MSELSNDDYTGTAKVAGPYLHPVPLLYLHGYRVCLGQYYGELAYGVSVKFCKGGVLQRRTKWIPGA